MFLPNIFRKALVVLIWKLVVFIIKNHGLPFLDDVIRKWWPFWKIFFYYFVPFISKNKCTKFQLNSIIIRDFSKGGSLTPSSAPPPPSTIGSQKKPNPCRVKQIILKQKIKNYFRQLSFVLWFDTLSYRELAIFSKEIYYYLEFDFFKT